MADTETLSKLYLELANVVPKETVSARELALQQVIDGYGVALMMIAEGCEGAAQFARKALEKAARRGPA